MVLTIKNIDSLKEGLPSTPTASVDLILTDPPYGINFQSNAREYKFKKIENDADLSWVGYFCKECYRILKPNTHLYCFTRYDGHGLFFDSFKEAGFQMKRTLLWIKSQLGMGDLDGDYAGMDEMILFMHKGRRPLNGGRDKNILSFSRLSDALTCHPTQKPPDLLAYLIRKSSEEGDLVFDPFMGVGSTGIACRKEKRNFLGFEIEQEYFNKAKYFLGMNLPEGSELVTN